MKQKVFETTFSKYFSEDIIGQGGSGQVFKVKDESENRYAIKILDPIKATNAKRKRFRNEINFCLKNYHQNIIPVIDHGVYLSGVNTTPFYVMPIYAGSLRSLLNRGIDPKKLIFYFAQLLDGVEAAHLQRVWHRDLKPENVLYDQTSDKLLVADFGIAHFGEDELHTLVETRPNDRLANFLYAAPEQKTRGLTVDHRADIFALGLMLNEMFTGDVPHGTGFKTIEGVAPDYRYLDGLVMEMIRQSPAERPASIEIIKQQLKARGLEFVESQKLSQLKQTVVPVSDIDDPLIADPPRIVDFDWDGQTLILIFNHPLNPKWKWALCNMGGYTSITGKGPDRFRIYDNKASIDARGNQIQQIIDHFKQWIPRANQVYKDKIIWEIRNKEQLERQQLKSQIEKEEDRLRVLKNINL